MKDVHKNKRAVHDSLRFEVLVRINSLNARRAELGCAAAEIADIDEQLAELNIQLTAFDTAIAAMPLPAAAEQL